MNSKGAAVKHLIPLTVLAVPLFSACDAATRYDTGAVVLEVSEPTAFKADGRTTPEFVSAYEAFDSQNYARAEALLDRALTESPRDPYALLAMGAVHERTGRLFTAADYYRSAARYGESAVSATEETDAENASDPAVTVAAVARESLDRMAQ